MIVYLNNKQVNISDTKNILEILAEDFHIDNPKGIAVAVNLEVVPKTNWNEFILKENDKVTIIKATQGG